MKAISLWQPWATAMANGVKRNETRSWPTKYVGDLVICSAKRRPSRQEWGDDQTFDEAMKSLPFGFAVCVVYLYVCVPTDDFIRSAGRAKLPLRIITEKEWELGNYEPGRFAWMTHDLRKLQTPIPIIGRQGFWNLSPEESKAIWSQLPGCSRPGCGYADGKPCIGCGRIVEA